MTASHAPTTRDSIRLLCKSVLNRLENQKAIVFPVRLRQVIQDEVSDLVGRDILTDQDLKERTLTQIGAKAELVDESQFADNVQFRTARSVIRKSFGDDELHGFYFQKPLKNIAEAIAAYLMRSSHIDDVFETDDDLIRMIVDSVKRFNASDMH